MMKLAAQRRLIPTCLAITLALTAVTSARCADLTKARAFLVWLYSHYPQPVSGPAFDPTSAGADRVFDAPMIALFRENHRLTPTGDIGALDGDPICDCQDDGALAASIGPILPDGPESATATVELRFGAASPREIRRLKYELVTMAHGQWRIHDIHSADTPSLRAYLVQANIEARISSHQSGTDPHLDSSSAAPVQPKSK